MNLELTNVYDVFVDEFDKNFKEFGIEAKDLIDSNINLNQNFVWHHYIMLRKLLVNLKNKVI